MSQKDLAIACGLAPSTVNAMESGQSTDMLVTTLSRLAHAVKATPDRLLGYDDPHLDLTRYVISLERPTVRESRESRFCTVCGRALFMGESHTQGECVVELSEHGKTADLLAAMFGFTPASIEFILDEEYARRSGRRL